MLKQEGLFMDAQHHLYELLVPKEHKLRKIMDLVDFSFVYEALVETYCPNNGRMAVSPVVLFKYLVLKSIYHLSDVDVVGHSLYDLSFKYFLEFDVEETKLIDPSLLTHFRRTRLQDVDLLDLIISKTIEIAKEQGVLKGHELIVDSTHTTSRYNQKTPKDALSSLTKNLRKKCYRLCNTDETLTNLKEKMPKKPKEGCDLESYMKYCEELTTFVQQDISLQPDEALQEESRYIAEIVEDNLVALKHSSDTDAKVGHKSADTSFYGYKNHLGINEDRLILAAIVTTGEKHDGKQLQALIEKSRVNGFEVKTVIGDGAYAEKDNLEYAEEHKIQVVANLSKAVTHGSRKKEFEYNKDTERYVCPAGHMAITKRKTGTGALRVEAYYFDIEKCKRCPLQEGCYKQGAASKTYSVKIKQEAHIKQKVFMETEFFQTKMKQRYKIEAKNAELKNTLGLRQTQQLGLLGMKIQLASAIFTSNINRIVRLMK